jgi:hypothetical protein
MAQKVSQLEGLFEFLEEGLDGPTAAVQIGDGLRAPSQMVGQKSHFPQLAVHFYHRADAAQCRVRELRAYESRHEPSR